MFKFFGRKRRDRVVHPTPEEYDRVAEFMLNSEPTDRQLDRLMKVINFMDENPTASQLDSFINNLK